MSEFMRASVYVILLAASPVWAGVMLTSVTRMEGAAGAEPMGITAQASVDGDNAKIVFQESGNPLMAEGSYILSQGKGKTMYMVHPQDKTYRKWDMDTVSGAAGQTMQRMKGMMRVKFLDPKVETLLDEKGEDILGCPTRHYRFLTTYSTETTMFGMKNTSKVEREQEVWTTKKLADEGLGLWLKKEPPRTFDEQLDALIKARMEKMEGFPLKSITKSKTTDGKGQTTTATTTMEVTEIKPMSFPPDTFSLPADFTEATILAPMQAAEEGVTNQLSPVKRLFPRLLRRGGE